MSKEILLIRHTTPEVAKGTCYGQLNLDVSSSYEDEVLNIKHIIRSFNPDVVFTSPLLRCKKLAESLYLKHPIHIDTRIMEMNFGEWEGKIWDNIPKKEINDWAGNFMNISPPGGERFSDLLTRSNAFFNEIEKSNSQSIAVITHSGVIRSFLMRYLDIPSEKIFNLQLNYGCIIKLNILGTHHQLEFLKG